MKANLKNIIGLAALGVTLVSTAVPTWAGWVFKPGVTIGTNQLGRFAKGSMVGARYSADNTQQIWCQSYSSIYTTPDKPTSGTSCYAKDSSGKDFSCQTTDPKFQEILQAMTDSSFIYILQDSAGSKCKDIRVYHGSEQLK